MTVRPFSFLVLGFLLLLGCENALLTEALAAKAQGESPVLDVTDSTQATVPSGGRISFADTPLGGTSTQVLTVRNSGKTPLALNASSASWVAGANTEDNCFTLSVSTSRIAAGHSASVTLGFQPSTAGPKSATVVLGTNDVNHPSFTLRVSGNMTPTGLMATPANHQVTLQWNNIASATAYKVYSATTSPVAVNATTLVATVTAASTFTKVGLANKTPYYYVVTSVGPYGESGPSTTVAATPFQLVAYLTSRSTENAGVGVQAFTVGASGTLTKTASSPVPDGGTGADAVTVDPLGRFAFVSNRYGTNSGKIYTYQIGSNGALSTVSGYIAQTSHGNAGNIAVDPAGKYAYVLNSLGSTPGWVDAYTIDAASGNLIQNGTALTTGGAYGQVEGIAVDPTGKFVYTATNNFGGYDGTIAGFAINQTTGALTQASWVSLTTPGWHGSNSIGFAPNGNFYVAEAHSSGQIEAFTRPNVSGLPVTNGRVVPDGQNCSLLAVDPLGRFVFTASTSAKSITVFKIQANGTLGAALGPCAAGPSVPYAIACEPTGRFLYVVTQTPLAPYAGAIRIYAIDQTAGTLTLVTEDTSVGNCPTAIAFGSLP